MRHSLSLQISHSLSLSVRKDITWGLKSVFPELVTEYQLELVYPPPLL